MNVFLMKIEWMPLVYGFIMFLGIWIMYYKLLHGKWLSLAWDIGIFVLVFKLHGGSMAGGFSAMIAALLAGVIFPHMRGGK